MVGKSDIEWTEATWNPIAGCVIVSPGCTNCYAQRLAARLQAMGSPKYEGTTRKSGTRHVWTGRVNIDATALEAPLRWRRPLRVFVNSILRILAGICSGRARNRAAIRSRSAGGGRVCSNT